MSEPYEYWKFLQAARGLASGSESLRKRIEYAYLTFHPVQEKDLSGHILELYAEIMERLTRVKDGDPGEGYVVNTLAAMTDQEAEKVAELIFDIFVEIAHPAEDD